MYQVQINLDGYIENIHKIKQLKFLYFFSKLEFTIMNFI